MSTDEYGMSHVLSEQSLNNDDVFQNISQVFEKHGIRAGQKQIQKLSPRGRELFFDWYEANKESADVPSVKSYFQNVLDDLVKEQTEYRHQYFQYLMANPGFLSTFGEDFVVEYGPMELSTQDQRNVNEYRATFSQEIRFYRREVWEKMQHANKLGLSDEVRDLQDRLRVAREQGDEIIVNALLKELNNRADDLSDLGLRMTSNGNLESV